MMTIEPPSRFLAPDLAAPFRRACALALLVGISGCGSGTTLQTVAPPTPASPWTLSWSDEFDGAAGSAPDPAKWTNDNSGDEYNGELETYTSLPVNVQQQNCNLVLTALKQDTTRTDGSIRHYTSGRIHTQGLFSQQYGRFEASIQMPLGKGIWPAFWLVSNAYATGNSSAYGEVDIFENIGDASTIYSTIHGTGYSIGATYKLPAGQAVNTAFHLYALEWAPNDIKFFCDDILIVEQTPASLKAGTSWAFNQPFFIILNVAVGGWAGSPDQTTIWPQTMLVDYVRVYTKNS